MPILRWLTRDEDLKSAGKTAYRLLEEVPELVNLYAKELRHFEALADLTLDNNGSLNEAVEKLAAMVQAKNRQRKNAIVFLFLLWYHQISFFLTKSPRFFMETWKKVSIFKFVMIFCNKTIFFERSFLSMFYGNWLCISQLFGKEVAKEINGLISVCYSQFIKQRFLQTNKGGIK